MEDNQQHLLSHANILNNSLRQASFIRNYQGQDRGQATVAMIAAIGQTCTCSLFTAMAVYSI